MSNRPIFVATHPRACSTAFERVFMTRQKTLKTFHEPFGDAFYYGPERLSDRYEKDEDARLQSGFSKTTYKDVMDSLESENEGKRVFLKDMLQYFVPPDGKAPTLAASLSSDQQPQEDGNPTVVPTSILSKFQFAFLIRHPRRAIPSYYRCTVPPLDKVTGFYGFEPSEAGYREMRVVFDYLREAGIVGPGKAGESNGVGSHVNVTVIDADDLLDRPAEVIEAFCNEVGIEFTPDMLKWECEENQKYAVETFEKWKGFHDDIINSTCFKPRDPSHQKKVPTKDEEDASWMEKYGEDGQKLIRETVDANVADYEYLKSFAIKFGDA